MSGSITSAIPSLINRTAPLTVTVPVATGSDQWDNSCYCSHCTVGGSTMREAVIMEWRKTMAACGSGCSGR
jgi:hypothetical protein